MTECEARFSINVKEGIVDLEGKEAFVDKHLEKFEEIFKIAIKEAMIHGLRANATLKASKLALPEPDLSAAELTLAEEHMRSNMNKPQTIDSRATDMNKNQVRSPARRPSPKPSPTLPPIPVDLKPGESKIGLREFYTEKSPANHYEKTAVFAYYLTKFNKQQQVRYGEILSCYEEVNEKKPSITDIIKNSIRYKGWLEQGQDKYSTRLTISGENFVKFDLPGKEKALLEPYENEDLTEQPLLK